MECMQAHDELIPHSSYRRVSQGSLQVYSDQAQCDLVARTMRSNLGPLGVDVRTMTAEEMVAEHPVLASSSSMYGVATAGDASGDIREYTRHMVRAAEKRGVEFRFGEEAAVDDFDRAAEGTVNHLVFRGSPQPRLAVDHVVVAAGNGAEALAARLGDVLMTYPVKGYALEIPVTGPLPTHNILNDVDKLYLCPLAALESGQRGDAIRISGFAEFAGSTQDIAVDRARGLSLLRKASTILPRDYFACPALYDASCGDAELWTALEAVQGFALHSCCRSQCPDDLPVIGQSPNAANVWYNAGHGHIGWTRGAGSAQLLCGLMCGRDDLGVNPLPYRVDRWGWCR